MAYSNNPLLPKARRLAVNLVLKQGLTQAQAARKVGVHRSTIYRWIKKTKGLHGGAFIHTTSSRPHAHPRQLPATVIKRILELRWQLKRCAAVLHAVLRREGVMVSLASVNRVLARHSLTNSWHGQPGKQRHKRTPRPRVEAPGDLVQVDTVHFNAKWGKSAGVKHYLYTLIDLKTRWVYAWASPRQNPELSAKFVMEAQKLFPYPFKIIQTDNGQEFSKKFEAILNENGMQQRRIRLGKKNDNAHIERFNRTIQDECLGRWPTPSTIQRKIDPYLDFYNNKRLHLGIQCNTPVDVLRRF